MVQNCTLDEQTARWDAGRITSETRLLLEAVSGARMRITAELLAEEIFCRVSEVARRYHWLPDQHSFRFQPRDGFDMVLRWDEGEKAVLLKLQWLQTGSFHFEKLKRFISFTAQSAAKALRGGSWNQIRSSFATGGLTLDAIVNTEIAREDAQISGAADALASTIEALRRLETRSR